MKILKFILLALILTLIIAAWNSLGPNWTPEVTVLIANLERWEGDDRRWFPDWDKAVYSPGRQDLRARYNQLAEERG